MSMVKELAPRSAKLRSSTVVGTGGLALGREVFKAENRFEENLSK
jgi:hypothetical protein